MKTIYSCLVGALLASTCASAALADDIAIVKKVGGKSITWQHDDTSSAARVQTLLVAGDKILAGKGSFAEVQFLADNCSIRVEAGSSLAIGEASPCAAASQQKVDAVKAADAKVMPAAVETAEVMDAKGPVVRVNKGEGMAAAVVGDSLKIGDSVFAGKDSSVSLYFAAAKCSYTVASSTVYAVTDKAPCQASAMNVVPTADVPSDNSGGVDPAVVAAGGIPPVLLLAGGAAAVAGAVAVIVANSDNDNGSPFSPD